MKKIFIIFTFFCIAVTSLFASDLRITEVFVDWSDEWVEISNIWSDTFVWSLILSGVKSTPLLISTTTIPWLSSLVIGDNLSMLSTFATIQVLTWRWLSLWDTSPIDIVLSQWNTVFDTFFVSGSLVQSMDNTMTSFQKLWNGWWFDVLATLSPFSSWVISDRKSVV